MRRIANVAFGALVAATAASTAGAQAPDIRLLGYNTNLSAVCNVGCTQLTLSLALGSLRPTDNRGFAVPGAIEALPDYIRNITFQAFGTNPTITGYANATPGFSVTIDNGPTNFAAALLLDSSLPLGSSTVGLTLFLAPGGNISAVSGSGLAYVDANLNFRDASGAVVMVPPALSPRGGPYYQTGDFNAFVTPTTDVTSNVAPEPASMVLFGTGVAMLVGVRLRRRA